MGGLATKGLIVESTMLTPRQGTAGMAFALLGMAWYLALLGMTWYLALLAPTFKHAFIALAHL